MFPGVSSSQDQLSLVCGRSPSLGSLRALKSQNLVGTRPVTRAQRMHTHATVSKVHQKAFQFHVRLRALSACGSTPRPRPGTKKKGNAQSRCKHLIPRGSIRARLQPPLPGQLSEQRPPPVQSWPPPGGRSVGREAGRVQGLSWDGSPGGLAAGFLPSTLSLPPPRPSHGWPSRRTAAPSSSSVTELTLRVSRTFLPS